MKKPLGCRLWEGRLFLVRMRWSLLLYLSMDPGLRSEMLHEAVSSKGFRERWKPGLTLYGVEESSSEGMGSVDDHMHF